MRESNNKHRANTRSQSNSESVEVCRPPRGQNNTESPTTIEDRSTGGLALPGDCPRPAPHRFERCAGLGVCKPEIPNAAVRCRGIPPRSRRGGCQTSFCLTDSTSDETDTGHPLSRGCNVQNREHKLSESHLYIWY
jgi:hypothetical protein